MLSYVQLSGSQLVLCILWVSEWAGASTFSERKTLLWNVVNFTEQRFYFVQYLFCLPGLLTCNFTVQVNASMTRNILNFVLLRLNTRCCMQWGRVLCVNHSTATVLPCTMVSIGWMEIMMSTYCVCVCVWTVTWCLRRPVENHCYSLQLCCVECMFIKCWISCWETEMWSIEWNTETMTHL